MEAAVAALAALAHGDPNANGGGGGRGVSGGEMGAGRAHATSAGGVEALPTLGQPLEHVHMDQVNTFASFGGVYFTEVMRELGAVAALQCMDRHWDLRWEWHTNPMFSIKRGGH